MATETVSKAVEKIKKLMEKDRFATTNGIELVEVREGYARAKLTVEDRHLNAGGVVQGGALFTLADYCFAAAVNSYGILTFSIQSSIYYFHSETVGAELYAESRELDLHNKVCTYQVDITNKAGQLVASFSSLGFRKAMTLPDDSKE